jgi:hypothetical protein
LTLRRDLSLRHRCYDLVGEVFTNCLFAFPSFGDSALPKCKQEKTRLAALKLLIELVKGDEDNMTHMLSLLSVQLQYVNLKVRLGTRVAEFVFSYFMFFFALPFSFSVRNDVIISLFLLLMDPLNA